jgi:hypothetical protein
LKHGFFKRSDIRGDTGAGAPGTSILVMGGSSQHPSWGWKMLGLEQSLGSRIVTYADDS